MFGISRRWAAGLGVLAIAPLGLVGLAAPSASAAQASPEAGADYNPVINPANFVAEIDNPYFPLKPGTVFVYHGTKDGQQQVDEVTVTSDTKEIIGVTCTVVHDEVSVKDQVTEDTYDWYAQDKDGNVWYFGEDSTEYEKGKADTGGSWESGVDGAKPGIIMPADPQVGDSYRQEYYAGEAEDMAEVLSLDESITVPYGSFDNVLMTNETSPLEPGVAEHKWYAKGVGEVSEEATAGEQEHWDLVDVTEAGGTPVAATPSQ